MNSFLKGPTLLHPNFRTDSFKITAKELCKVVDWHLRMEYFQADHVLPLSYKSFLPRSVINHQRAFWLLFTSVSSSVERREIGAKRERSVLTLIHVGNGFTFINFYFRVQLVSNACYFRCTAKWFSYTSAYPFFVSFFPHGGYDRIFSGVLCAVQ